MEHLDCLYTNLSFSRYTISMIFSMIIFLIIHNISYFSFSRLNPFFPPKFEGKFRPKRGGVNCKGRD